MGQILLLVSVPSVSISPDTSIHNSLKAKYSALLSALWNETSKMNCQRYYLNI